ncbi:lipoyl(octanoyl) transferase [Phycisphaerales bacterium]|nr:lipoyl(octanoyl) transferase [Phycisphaerales bacterium]
MAYAPAYDRQVQRVEAVLAARAQSAAPPEPPASAGFLLLVEHDPVVTVSRRPQARQHLIATPELLARHGVSVAETDRGGDITYHGPGQLVVYPILDLNLLNLGLHDYMRLLEGAIIDACAAWGLPTQRDPAATGVWVPPRATHPRHAAKVCAMGVRVRRWISMHGLALNVATNLEHFDLIVPCGLVGRPVTSLSRELGAACPSMDDAKREVVAQLRARINAAYASAIEKRRVARADAPADTPG